ncbi:hypothetical protein TNCT_307161 [Trichonephila clavata]|uniref:PiggyBac transposable element-derived protein domain-containing protein n=1 Tax=Trichonephila clavata TaxID=2740835 RepID=A0A8X6FB16_TRICU|nr:hypothetical protein TNCT_307161 [Trichonephila clavata]
MSLCFVISKIVQRKKLTSNWEKNEWSTTLDELDAFISILYARGIYDASNLELENLWSVVWGAPFFRDTMARDRFRELMKFLQFDKKTAQSECL